MRSVSGSVPPSRTRTLSTRVTLLRSLPYARVPPTNPLTPTSLPALPALDPGPLDGRGSGVLLRRVRTSPASFP